MRNLDDYQDYKTPLELRVDRVINPFQEFIKRQSTASYALFICTIIAVFFASLPLTANFYDHLINMPLGIKIGNFSVVKTLTFFTNDVLLTIFFFFVGLEIKREFLVGELTNFKQEILIIFAALGGVLFPAIIFAIFNYNSPTIQGWGIPIGTDTAFALGILFFLKNRIAKGTLSFMVGLAIIDDILAIIVIALFYTTNLQLIYLFYAVPVAVSLLALNYSGIKSSMPYILLGALLWLLVEYSQVHGTLAGIITAFLIPARPKKAPKKFVENTKHLIDTFEAHQDKQSHVLADRKQHSLLQYLETITIQTTTPLQRWESKLQLPVTLFILPLFALLNAGIPLNGQTLSKVFTHQVSLGIIFGLVFGKPLGILLFTRLALFLKIGKLPKKLNYKNLLLPAVLAGIGFTMSLFIANLCFYKSQEILVISKLAILMSSVISALAAFALVRNSNTATEVEYRTT